MEGGKINFFFWKIRKSNFIQIRTIYEYQQSKNCQSIDDDCEKLENKTKSSFKVESNRFFYLFTFDDDSKDIIIVYRK